MSEKTVSKHRELKARLIEAARNRIIQSGLANLRARDVTQDAGCSLGGLYTVFADLSELIIYVNSQTLATLEASLRLIEARHKSATDRLRNLGQGYMRFAIENPNLWRALFEYSPSETDAIPQWHLEEHLFLMDVIAEPLAELQPGMSPEDRAVRARTLFGAVHGVISISLEARFVGLPQDRLAQEIDELILTIAAGAEQRLKT